MTHATVAADKGRLAGCCAVPHPRAGRPHVRLWTGDSTDNRFLSVELDVAAALALGEALLAAAATLDPMPRDFDPGQLRIHVEDPDAEA